MSPEGVPDNSRLPPFVPYLICHVSSVLPLVQVKLAKLEVISLALNAVGVTGAATVMSQLAVISPSKVEVTVIVASPGATAVTTPLELTVATEVLLDSQVTSLIVASFGEIVAVSVFVSPATISHSVGSTVTLVTATAFSVLKLISSLQSL